MLAQPFANLPEALRLLRLRRRMTQRELAAAAGMSKQRIGDFERGAARPRLDALERIMRSLRVEALELVRTMREVKPRKAEIRRRRCKRNGRPPEAASASGGRSAQAFERFLETMAWVALRRAVGRKEGGCTR